MKSKIIKLCSLISLFLICGLKSYGCVYDYSNHLPSVMFVVPFELTESYNSGKYYYCSYVLEKDIQKAKKNNDKEKEEYLNLLSEFLHNRTLDYNAWEYPSERSITLFNEENNNLLKQIDEYKGKRYRSKYALFKMYVNMRLKKHTDNIKYWEEYACKLPQSKDKERMKNVYAGALYHTGKIREAFDLFASQNDWESIKWCVRRFRGVNGIKEIYRYNPNSLALYYLLQDFVNSFEKRYYDKSSSIKNLNTFILFAKEVVEDNTISDKCLWLTSIAMSYYFTGELEEAKTYIDKAMQSKGKSLVKDNARCIRLLIYASMKNSSNSFLANEFKWLDKKIKKKDDLMKYFLEAKERILLKALALRYEKEGEINKYLSVWALYDNKIYTQDANKKNYWNSYYCPYALNFEVHSCKRPYYHGEYVEKLLELSPQQLENYYNYIRKRPTNKLERYIFANIYKSKEYFYEMIGTKYMTKDDFVKAEKYLRYVSLDFTKKQRIYYYMQHRDYSIPSWPNYKGRHKSKKARLITENEKLKYCREMIYFKHIYEKTKNEDLKQKAAYELGVRYSQATRYNDWWLFTYGLSVNNTMVFEGKKHFEELAYKYFNESKYSKDWRIMISSIWGIYRNFNSAQFPTWDFDLTKNEYIPFAKNINQRNIAYNILKNFYKTYPKRIPKELSNCTLPLFQ